MRQHQLNIWDRSDPRRQELIQERLTTADEFALWVKKKEGNTREIAANGVLVHCQI